MTLRMVTFRPAGGIRMDVLLLMRGEQPNRALIGGLALVAVGLWSSLGADPWTSLSDSLTFPTSPTDSGWRDVAYADGVAEVDLPVIDVESEAVTEMLLVTAFGSPGERTTVELQWEPGTESNHRSWNESAWNPLPPSFPRRQAVAAIPGRYPPKPGSFLRTASLDSGNISVRTDSPADRMIDFPKPGHRGLRNADFATTSCRVAWSGQCSRVWLPNDEPHDSRLNHWVQRLGELLEQVCLPTVEADQGPWPDVDGDGRLNLLVTNRVGQTSPDVKAFVRQVDFQADVPLPWGQNWDVVYVQPGTNLGELRSILIHELTHVAQFSWCRKLFPAQPWPIPDWMTEGLAHAAELRSGGKWDNTLPRLRTFAERPANCPLVVSDAVVSGLWRDPGQRGASAAFCDWWTRRRPEWRWPELLTSYAEHEDPWTELAGAPFPDVYRDWTISLATEGVPMSSSDTPLELRGVDVSAGTPYTIVLTGTATAYVRIQRNLAAAQTLFVETGAENRLQITALRLPAATER